MSRPLRRSPAATRSIARAICGRARRTASATTASSALIRLAISSDDLRSRSSASGCDCSVRRRRRSPVSLSFLAFKNVLSTSPVQSFHHRVVNFRPDPFDRLTRNLVRTVRPGPVRQQDYRKFARWVYPQRGSCIAEVTVGLRRKIFPGLRGRRRRVPSQGARRCPRSGCRRGFSSREQSDSLGPQNRKPTAEHGMREAGKVPDARKNSGVPGHSAKHAGVFVLHFTLDNALAKHAVVLRRRDFSASLKRWIVSGVPHAQRSEDFALAEAIERFRRHLLQRLAQNNKSNVTVFGTRPRLGNQRGG